MKSGNKKSSTELKKNSMLIMCECGTAFLIIPDAKQMGRVIDAHAEKHGKKEQDPEQVNTKIRYIQDLLLKQVFEETSII